MEKDKQEDKRKSAGVYGVVPEKDDYPRNPGRKQNEWSEVLKMTGDKDADIRKRAVGLLSPTFQKMEDKSEVFFDLVKLTESKDAYIREKAAELLSVAFVNSENKQKAWNELVRLASVEDRKVRKGAVLSLSSGYTEAPDKEKAWEDLIRLSVHSDNFVKQIATRTLGVAFFYVSDKTQAWKDLQSLINNPYLYVRMYAFRALGRASLWRALKAENEATYIFGLKEAVKYFKEAAETSVDFDIHEFYQPFYEALLFILFSDRPGIAKLESEQYLSKMTDEVSYRKENPKFMEAFQQLTEFLRRAGDLTQGDLSAQKELLETSILTFDAYSSLFESEEDKEIIAQKTLKKEKIVKKGYSKLGKELLDSVEEKKSSLAKKTMKK
ncbi:MAG TPA: hypothetical protein VGK06_09060 [Methanosarcina sp.]